MASRPHTFSLTPDAADDNGISVSQTPAAGGAQNLTITGALASGGVATMDVARQVIITSAGDESGRTFSVTGTNVHGDVIKEDITGINIGVATSVHDYKTVTQVQVDADTAGAVLVGTSGVLASAWYPLNRIEFATHSIAGIISGTANYDAELTYDDLFNLDVAAPQTAGAAPTVFNHATVVNETTSQEGTIAAPATGVRLKINSFTAGAVVSLTIIPASS